MSAKLKQLVQEIVALPMPDRAFLLDRLVESLDEPVDRQIEQAWLDEADRRWKEIEDGKVECVPAAQAMREAFAALKKCG